MIDRSPFNLRVAARETRRRPLSLGPGASVKLARRAVVGLDDLRPRGNHVERGCLSGNFFFSISKAEHQTLKNGRFDSILPRLLD